MPTVLNKFVDERRSGDRAAHQDEGQETLDWALIGRAVGMFAVTNIDDIVVLAVFFGRAARSGSAAALRTVSTSDSRQSWRCLCWALSGRTLLPESGIPYLGLLPLF